MAVPTLSNAEFQTIRPNGANIRVPPKTTCSAAVFFEGSPRLATGKLISCLPYESLLIAKRRASRRSVCSLFFFRERCGQVRRDTELRDGSPIYPLAPQSARQRRAAQHRCANKALMRWVTNQVCVSTQKKTARFRCDRQMEDLNCAEGCRSAPACGGELRLATVRTTDELALWRGSDCWGSALGRRCGLMPNSHRWQNHDRHTLGLEMRRGFAEKASSENLRGESADVRVDSSPETQCS